VDKLSILVPLICMIACALAGVFAGMTIERYANLENLPATPTRVISTASDPIPGCVCRVNGDKVSGVVEWKIETPEKE